MSADWQESWSQAVQYWSHHWRRWIGVAAVLTGWLWAICLAVPSVDPFVLMEFQPINSHTIVRTYQSELSRLSQAVPVLIGILLVTTILGGLLAVYFLRKLGRRSGIGVTVGAGAITTGVALLAMAMIRIPLGGQYLQPLDLVVRGLVILLLLAVVVPVGFWIGPLAARQSGSPLGRLRQMGRDGWYLPWTWLLAVVVGEMLSAAISWTIPVRPLGTLVLSFLVVASGMLHQSVAYFYRRPAEASSHRNLPKSSENRV